MEEVTALYKEFEIYLAAFLLCLPRAYAFIAASQLLAPTAVPRMARNVAILVICLPITPIMLPLAPVFAENLPLYFGYFAKEIALGFIMGYIILWFFWSVQAAGAYIDNQRGAAIASSIDPLQGHESSPLGILFSQAFITYFFTVGGFLLIINLLYISYREWPVYELVPIYIEAFPALMFELLDLGMRLAVVFSAPVIAVMFLTEFALAMVSRFAPQIQVFILAMPIKSAVAMVILVFYIPIMFRYALGNQDMITGYMEQFWEILRTGDEVGAPPTP